MVRFLPALLIALSAPELPGQAGQLDQDNTIRDNLSWNMGFFNDHQQDVNVGIAGQLTGFTLRMATQNVANGLPVAVFAGPGPHAPSATPLFSTTVFATIRNAWQEVLVDTSSAGLRFQVGDVFVIRCGDATTFSQGVDLTGNSGWPTPFYVPLFYEDGTLRTLDRLYFRSYMLPCTGGQVARYGRGCPGTSSQTPLLTLTGCPLAGASVSIDVTNALGGSAGVLFFGLGQGNIPLGPQCDLLAVPLIPTPIPLSLSGSGAGGGTASFPGILPPFTGTRFTLQAFVLDPGTSLGLSATNGVDVLIG